MVKITMIDCFRDKFLKNSQKSNANKSCAFSQNNKEVYYDRKI